MKLLKRFVPWLLLVLLFLVAYFNYPKLTIISGYASKSMASTVFISHRSSQSVIESDHNIPLIKLAEVESRPKMATATFFGLMERKTICREGLGCVLINDKHALKTNIPTPHREALQNDLPFPYGNNGSKDTLFDNVDYDQLKRTLDSVFVAIETSKTRTVLVAYKNQIIAERYADGFTEETPILGWSMTKSILATLYGILEHQGKLDLNSYTSIASWQNDERKHITFNHLLRMQSGLEWEEDYSKISDVTRMLFLNSDMTTAQMEKNAIARPTEIWNYSSGTTNLLSGILRKQFETHQEYVDFPYAALIDKIGMHSMIIEADMTGNFVGSSYAWANTRDWAKFGLLYLNKGNWNGTQLFSSAWVDYIKRPTLNSDGTYGAHFWLNAEGKYPDVPRDLFSANGFQGQRVFIIPSKDLVVVRTGISDGSVFDINTFLKDIIASID
ncbi:serine hydrolase [uncultured Kriegella sp.]|uniref:serine hydrolase domain-containing protein n=1 Tax=uncultured Kriegella sp. TaxID=1798910 RepID=UPI0030DDB5B6|tara:strand:+ start:139221 stop:140552 length:1332 start_codon:yes stop_codon:yes gene_type:complete